MIDVAIAAAILAVVVGIALQFILALSGSAQNSLLRANARRQATMVRTALQTDLGSAMPCGSNRFRSPLVAINDPDGLGDGSLVLFTDLDADADADLVAYRVDGTRLERAVLTNTTGCAALPDELGAATWTLMAQPVRTLDGASHAFVARERGAENPFAGDCTAELTACRADVIATQLLLDAPGAGRVSLDESYLLPDTVAGR